MLSFHVIVSHRILIYHSIFILQINRNRQGHLRGLLAGRGLVHGVGQQGEIGGEGRTKFLGDAQRVVVILIRWIDRAPFFLGKNVTSHRTLYPKGLINITFIFYTDT